jgi:hypothetical protein
MSTCALGDIQLGVTALCLDEAIITEIIVTDTIGLTEQITTWTGILQVVTDSLNLAETITTPTRTLKTLDAINTLETIRTLKTLKIPETIHLTESIQIPTLPPPPTPPPPPTLPTVPETIKTIERIKKLEAKFKPEIVSTKLSDIQEVALQRAEKGIYAQRTVTIAVATYLDSKGITGGERANYIAFAEALWKHVHRQRGTAAQNIANGLIAYYTSTYKLNTTYLQEIAQIILAAT